MGEECAPVRTRRAPFIGAGGVVGRTTTAPLTPARRETSHQALAFGTSEVPRGRVWEWRRVINYFDWPLLVASIWARHEQMWRALLAAPAKPLLPGAARGCRTVQWAAQTAGIGWRPSVWPIFWPPPPNSVGGRVGERRWRCYEG